MCLFSLIRQSLHTYINCDVQLLRWKRPTALFDWLYIAKLASHFVIYSALSRPHRDRLRRLASVGGADGTGRAESMQTGGSRSGRRVTPTRRETQRRSVRGPGRLAGSGARATRRETAVPSAVRRPASRDRGATAWTVVAGPRGRVVWTDERRARARRSDAGFEGVVLGVL